MSFLDTVSLKYSTMIFKGYNLKTYTSGIQAMFMQMFNTMPDPSVLVLCVFVQQFSSGKTSLVDLKSWAVPFRLDAIFQDSNVALSLVQWQNIYKTTICFDYPCMDGCFTNTGVLWRESVEVEKDI